MARPKNPANNYWAGEEMDDWIDQYNKSNDAAFRNTLFEEKLYAPFCKLVECIHNRYQWHYINDSSETRQTDLVSFITSVMHNYDKSKGPSFSYFNIVCKNYLVQKNEKGYKETLALSILPDDTMVDDSEVWPNSNTDVKSLRRSSEAKRNLLDNQDKTAAFWKFFLQYLEDNFEFIFNKQDRRLIGRAFLDLAKVEGGDILYKKEFFNLMRERTGFISSKISRTLFIISGYYNDVKKAWYDDKTAKVAPPSEYAYWKNFRNWDSMKHKPYHQRYYEKNRKKIGDKYKASKGMSARMRSQRCYVKVAK